jgi:hypothetical protein
MEAYSASEDLRTAKNSFQNIHSTLSPMITLLVQKSVKRTQEKSAGFNIRACKSVHYILKKVNPLNFKCEHDNQETTYATHHESVQRMVLRDSTFAPKNE